MLMFLLARLIQLLLVLGEKEVFVHHQEEIRQVLTRIVLLGETVKLHQLLELMQQVAEAEPKLIQ